MKVICKNCGKRFDFETYMGLCPKCSTYYREGKEYRSKTASGAKKHGKVYYGVTLLLLTMGSI